MKCFSTLEEWCDIRKRLKDYNIGLVPTMGNLHAGHISLCQKSHKENDVTVVSIFINPLQFNDPKDFKIYPRTLEQDLLKLQEAKVSYCFTPNVDILYADSYKYLLSCNTTPIMEDLKRPGHFTGVLTVVLKLLNIINPHNAYFGEKDYQQFMYIKDMAQALFLPVKIHSGETIRHNSGLALSSRNNLLNDKALKIAYEFAKIFHNKDYSLIEIRTQLMNYPIELEYLEEHYGRRFIAVYIDGIRLIDNYKV